MENGAFLFYKHSPLSITSSGCVVIACPFPVCCCSCLFCHEHDYYHCLSRCAQTLMMESSGWGDVEAVVEKRREEGGWEKTTWGWHKSATILHLQSLEKEINILIWETVSGGAIFLWFVASFLSQNHVEKMRFGDVFELMDLGLSAISNFL